MPMKATLTFKSFLLLIAFFFGISNNSYSQCGVSVTVTDNGDGTSTLMAVVTGASTNGSDTYTYSWDTGDTGDQTTVPSDGSLYCVTVTDDYTEQVEIDPGYWVYDGYYDYYGYWVDTSYYVDPVYGDQPASCSASDCGNAATTDCSGTNVTISETNPGQLDAIASGSGSISYLWTPNGETTQSINTVSGTTNYGVTITDSNGCTASDSFTTQDCSGTGVTIYDTNPGQLDAVCAGTGPYTYAWTPNGETTQTINTTPGTTYGVTITDANGCTASDSYTTQDCSNTNVTISETNPGQLDAIANGSGSISYLWTPNGETTQSINTVSGTTNYGVTITDANGCTDSDSYTTQDCSNTSVTISETNPGQLDATASGTSPYTYVWTPNGETTQSINTVSGTTNYGVTITDANGCTDSDSYTTQDCSSTNVTISETNPGQLDAIASGSGSISYLWTPNGETTQSINTVSGTTNYGVTITDANGCTATDSYSLTQDCSATDVTISETNPGQLDATCTGTGPYTYVWTPNGETTQSINTVSGTTNYGVTITDANGCTATDSYSLTQDCSATDVTISETNPGQLDATCTGTGPYTYTWTHNGETTQSINTVSGTTNYGVTITDANGCTATDSYTTNAVPDADFSVDDDQPCKAQIVNITDNSSNNPTSWQWTMPGGTPASSTAQNPTVKYNTPGTYTITLIATNSFGASSPVDIQVTVNGTPTVSVLSQTICSGDLTALIAIGADNYLWSDGWPFSINPVTPTVTTNYTVVGTTDCGTVSATGKVTVKPNPTIGANSATICPGSSATLTATGGTSYSWDTGSNAAATVVSPTVTTTYNVTGTGANGCSNVKTTTVTVKPAPTVTANSPTICVGKTATLTAGGATSYHWNTGPNTTSITVSPTTTTIYTVTGTANTCSTALTVTVDVQPLPSVSVISATICSGAAGTLIASGANTYSWNTGVLNANLIATPTVNTTYTVTGTSVFGCVKTATGSINTGTAPVIVVNSATICAGTPTVLTANGITSFTWSTGANTNTISVNPASNTVYTVSGSLSGCSAGATKTVAVTVKPSPATAVTSPTICSGANATLSASGATTYSWSTGATIPSQVVTPTTTTIYTVTGSSSNGCKVSVESTVTVKSSPNLVVNSQTICAGKTATLSVTGGTTYAWSNSATTNSIAVTPTINTNYTVTSTSNGCSATKVVSVAVNPLPALTVVSPTICAAANATLIASGAASYSWSTGSTASSFTVHPTASTVYTVTGTTALGCSKTLTASVTISSTPGISVSSVTTCVGTSTVLTANGVTSYTWSTGLHTNFISVNPSATTVYTVSGNLTGCTGTAISTATVTVKPLPSVSLAPLSSNTMCVIDPSVTLVGSPSGGSYSGPGVVSNKFDPSVAGAGTFVLQYTYTNTSGCSASASRTVNVDVCTGIEDFDISNLSIYPNPTRDIITISLNSSVIGTGSLQLFNSVGQLITSQKITEANSTLDLQNWANGIYILKIYTNNHQVIKKIIKQN